MVGRWPDRTMEERFWEKVDKSGDCWLWIACLNKDGYGTFRDERGTTVAAHRVSYELLVGTIPEGLVLDHNVTCPKRCVNPAHLRPATTKQNLENRAGPQANCRSGVLGVYRGESGWHAHVTHHGERFYLGTFKTIAAAESAVVAKRLELFTHNQLDRSEA